MAKRRPKFNPPPDNPFRATVAKDQTKTELVRLRMTKQQRDEVINIAMEDDVSMTDIIIKALRDLFRRRINAKRQGPYTNAKRRPVKRLR